ncbi:hypothetical protein DFJ77DRAFT_42042 [Powellomyces hirtus]|nr:hypothetical protein DFJ77DRAFT_42042 [Powellomyces hirtus]
MASLQDDVFCGQIKILQSMGFPDVEVNRAALHQTEGKINAAVDLIVSGEPITPVSQAPPAILTSFDPLLQGSSTHSPARSPLTPKTPSTPTRKYRPLPPDQQHAIFQLHQMGFRQEGKSRDALNGTKWNVDAAVAVLLDRGDELNEDYDLISAPPTSELQGLGSVAWPSSTHVRQHAPHQQSPQHYQPQPQRSFAPPPSRPIQGYTSLLPESHNQAWSHHNPRQQPVSQTPEDEDPFGDNYRIDK